MSLDEAAERTDQFTTQPGGKIVKKVHSHSGKKGDPYSREPEEDKSFRKSADAKRHRDQEQGKADLELGLEETSRETESSKEEPLPSLEEVRAKIAKRALKKQPEKALAAASGQGKSTRVVSQGNPPRDSAWSFGHDRRYSRGVTRSRSGRGQG